jgi:hypothetical protein
MLMRGLSSSFWMDTVQGARSGAPHQQGYGAVAAAPPPAAFEPLPITRSGNDFFIYSTPTARDDIRLMEHHRL